ncbi:PspC domain-containing protein [Paraglaciecola sp.]|uniref:PspC domain-containing protein n=1 Tax=Paraglaciecola sp. TaxID=1920173 RepID=UPI003EF24565
MRNIYEVNRLYKDSAHRKISGVCSGLARHWNVPRSLIRVAAIVCLIALPMVTVIAYIAATVLLPNR